MSLPLEKGEKIYTYADYLNWPEEEIWELIDGTPHYMTSPLVVHQAVSMELALQIGTFLKENKKSCKVFQAPLDVALADAEAADDEIINVVQPDILVVCDPSKIEKRGVRGAPDFIIEILSPSTSGVDHIRKRALYEKYGVKEYWIVDPANQFVSVLLLGEDGKYAPDVFHDKTKNPAVKTLPGLEIDLEKVFEEEFV